MNNKQINHPECCGKCVYWRIEEQDTVCSITEKPVPYSGKLPDFCPYVLEEIKLKSCDNCLKLETINGKTIYAWCPVNKWAYESFEADTRHACCRKWEEK